MIFEAEIQGFGAPYLVEFFDLVFRERYFAGPAAAFYLAGVGSENLCHPDNLTGGNVDCLVFRLALTFALNSIVFALLLNFAGSFRISSFFASCSLRYEFSLSS